MYAWNQSHVSNCVTLAQIMCSKQVILCSYPGDILELCETHAASHGSETLLKEHAVCSLLHTWPHRCLLLATFAVIDKGERVCPSHPKNTACFVFLMACGSLSCTVKLTYDLVTYFALKDQLKIFSALQIVVKIFSILQAVVDLRFETIRSLQSIRPIFTISHSIVKISLLDISCFSLNFPSTYFNRWMNINHHLCCRVLHGKFRNYC